MTTENNAPLSGQVERALRDLKMLDDATLGRPERTRTIVIANQEGCMGKTTTAVEMAAGIALGGLIAVGIDGAAAGNTCGGL